MTFSFDVYRHIDQRVNQAGSPVILPGVATTYSYKSIPGDATSSTRVDVTFHGSTAVVTVKCFEGVQVRAGDRVGLIKIGTDWVCFGSHQTGWPNIAIGQGELSVGNTSSTTPVNMPGDPFLTFTKRHRDAGVIIMVWVSSYVTSAGIPVTYSVRGIPIGPSVAAFTSTSHSFLINTANAHLQSYGQVFLPSNHDSSEPGTWEYHLQWSNTSGGPAGTVFTDTWDDVRMIAIEVGPEVTLQAL